MVAGARPWTRMASLASGVSTTSALPSNTRRTIWRAARSASMDTRGKEAPTENQPYSAGWLPVNSARRWEPVRISPGTTVVTLTPVPDISARSP